MKVQLKFRNQLIEGYLIDENATIFDLEGNIQETYIHQGRPTFKKVAVHRYVMHSFNGYREGMEIHHLNEDKCDNRLENLVYLTKAEHTSLHFKGKKRTQETRIKIAEAHKGKKLSEEHKKKLSEALKGQKMSEETTKRMSDARKGRVCVNNGFVNKMVYPDQIPEGFVRGMLRNV